MGKRFYKIIVACFLLIINSVAYGQEQPKKAAPACVTIASAYRTAFIQHAHPRLFRMAGSIPVVVRVMPRIASLPASVSPDAYTRQFGFFCRKELQFEKVTGIPFRFRLGSLAYSNALEGK